MPALHVLIVIIQYKCRKLIKHMKIKAAVRLSVMFYRTAFFVFNFLLINNEFYYFSLFKNKLFNLLNFVINMKTNT